MDCRVKPGNDEPLDSYFRREIGWYSRRGEPV
jgi:hypothetical protein